MTVWTLLNVRSTTRNEISQNKCFKLEQYWREHQTIFSVKAVFRQGDHGLGHRENLHNETIAPIQ